MDKLLLVGIGGISIFMYNKYKEQLNTKKFYELMFDEILIGPRLKLLIELNQRNYSVDDLDKYIKDAKNGSKIAQYMLGDILFDLDDEYDNDIKNKNKLIEQSRNQGNPKAMYLIANNYNHYVAQYGILPHNTVCQKAAYDLYIKCIKIPIVNRIYVGQFTDKQLVPIVPDFHKMVIRQLCNCYLHFNIEMDGLQIIKWAYLYYYTNPINYDHGTVYTGLMVSLIHKAKTQYVQYITDDYEELCVLHFIFKNTSKAKEIKEKIKNKIRENMGDLMMENMQSIIIDYLI